MRFASERECLCAVHLACWHLPGSSRQLILNYLKAAAAQTMMISPTPMQLLLIAYASIAVREPPPYHNSINLRRSTCWLSCEVFGLLSADDTQVIADIAACKAVVPCGCTRL